MAEQHAQTKPMTPDTFAHIGEQITGERKWVRPLAQLTHLNETTIRRYANGDLTVPDQIAVMMISLLWLKDFTDLPDLALDLPRIMSYIAPPKRERLATTYPQQVFGRDEE